MRPRCTDAPRVSKITEEERSRFIWNKHPPLVSLSLDIFPFFSSSPRRRRITLTKCSWCRTTALKTMLVMSRRSRTRNTTRGKTKRGEERDVLSSCDIRQFVRSGSILIGRHNQWHNFCWVAQRRGNECVLCKCWYDTENRFFLSETYFINLQSCHISKFISQKFFCDVRLV